MTHEHEPDYNLLAEYLSGMASPSQVAEVERWLGEHPARRTLVEQMQGTWDVVQKPSRPPMDVEAMTRAVLRRANGESSLKTLRGWVGYTAVAALFISISLIGINELIQSKFSATPLSVTKKYHTSVGQRARLTLPDSSTIILGPNTSVRYMSDFGSSNRTVFLDGQALFTVAPNTNIPFIVRTGEVTTRVLGTSFSVRKYVGDTAVSVVVAQGRVAVDATVVGTGDAAIVTGDRRVSIVRGSDVATQLAWSEGRLVFAGTPLRDVIPELERWYGMSVDVTDTRLLSRLVSTTLDVEPPSRAAELVGIAVSARVEFKNGRARFSLR